MIIGTNKETKDQEYRVAILPSGVEVFIQHGHKILIEKGAGQGIGISDTAYQKSGATIVDDPEKIYEEAELIYKVKEPMTWEYDLFRKGQTLFTYIHSAGNRPLCDKLLDHSVYAIAYEDIELDNGGFPLLAPMSTIAGYMGMLKGFELLQTINGGPGLIPGGLPGIRPTHVMILGGGSAGVGALKVALGLGAEATILDIDVNKLMYISDCYPRVRTLISNPQNIEETLKQTDILLNAVMWPKSKKGHLVTRDMLKLMPNGAVIVDVSADIHGAIETCERQTTHKDPVYVIEGHPHYAVANIASLVARSASDALANVTLPYALEIANKGVRKALIDNVPLRRGLTCFEGHMVRKITAEWYGCEYLGDSDVVQLLKKNG